MKLHFLLLLSTSIIWCILGVSSYHLGVSQISDLNPKPCRTTSVYETFKYEERKDMWDRIKYQLKKKQNLPTLEDKPAFLRWVWKLIYPSSVTQYDKMPLPSYVKLLVLENLLKNTKKPFNIQDINYVFNMNI
uniref:PRESAN domain-containing protein n=1 Tax=Strongyloides venezuelensis TaxID=75913 RepID=A0A0K0G056_STRVS